MADIALTSAPVVWTVANQIAGSVANGANGYVEFEASTVAYFHGGLTVLPSPQRAEVIDGEMTAIELPVNDPEVWNWKVTPHVGVNWPSFYVNVPEGGTDLSSAAVTPGIGPVRVLQGPQGGSVVGAEDQGDGTIRFVLDDGTRTDPMPITRGPAGPANRLAIGTVMKGEEPYASLVGEAPAQTLNLVLPKGDPGNPEDLVDATPEQRGLMAAQDKAHLDLTPTRAEVAESTARTLVETYSLESNFDAIRPRYITRPDIRVNNVMQSFGRTSNGHYYIAQAVSITDDLSISRCDAGGRIIDTSILTGGGHGASVGVEEQPDGVYIWVWWDANVDGTRNVLKRWKYVGGATVSSSDAETMPDFGSGMSGFRWVGLTINQHLDLIGINNRTQDGDNIELRRFSEYVAGTDNVLAKLPTLSLSTEGAFQSMVVTDDHCYVHRGDGSAGVNQPRMDQFSWASGEKVASKDLSGLAYLGGGSGKNEANGICQWYDAAGRLSLLFGIDTGASGANIHSIYSLAPADFQDDTGVGAALQRVFSPMNWVPVQMNPGFEPRSELDALQVAKDASGMVHLRGQMSNTGLEPLTSNTAFGVVPREFWPVAEVRWIGWVTGRASRPWGGWISASGVMTIQADSRNEDPGPVSHFTIIIQPWQAKA